MSTSIAPPTTDYTARDRVLHFEGIASGYSVTRRCSNGVYVEDLFDTHTEAWGYAVSEISKARTQVRLWAVDVKSGALRPVDDQPSVPSSATAGANEDLVLGRQLVQNLLDAKNNGAPIGEHLANLEDWINGESAHLAAPNTEIAR